MAASDLFEIGLSYFAFEGVTGRLGHLQSQSMTPVPSSTKCRTLCHELNQ